RPSGTKHRVGEIFKTIRMNGYSRCNAGQDLSYAVLPPNDVSLLLFPAQPHELAKQRFLAVVELDRVRRGRRPRVAGLAHVAVDPLLRGREALPAADGCGEVHVAPGRMARRLTQLVGVREEGVDEFLGAAVAVRVVRPVEGNHDRAGRERVDLLPLRHEVWIVFAR